MTTQSSWQSERADAAASWGSRALALAESQKTCTSKYLTQHYQKMKNNNCEAAQQWSCSSISLLFTPNLNYSYTEQFPVMTIPQLTSVSY